MKQIQHSPAEEQRANEIAVSEGRGRASNDDFRRALDELRAPNEITHEPEVAEEPESWSRLPGGSGKQAPETRADRANIGKKLVEQGMRNPVRHSRASRP